MIFAEAEPNEWNFIVVNGHNEMGDAILFFDGEDINFITPKTSMLDILVALGIFKSKGQARKNWKRTGVTVPDGFTDLKKVGKLNKRITLFNPTAILDEN